MIYNQFSIHKTNFFLKNFPKSIQNKTVYEINEEAFEEYKNYRNIYHEETK